MPHKTAQVNFDLFVSYVQNHLYVGKDDWYEGHFIPKGEPPGQLEVVQASIDVTAGHGVVMQGRKS